MTEAHFEHEKFNPAMYQGPREASALNCQTCGRPRCVPTGSKEARCFQCEPELLWDAAKRAHEERLASESTE